MNFEMESATLFTMCSALGLRAGMVAGAIVNRTQQEIPNEAAVKDIEKMQLKLSSKPRRIYFNFSFPLHKTLSHRLSVFYFKNLSIFSDFIATLCFFRLFPLIS